MFDKIKYYLATFLAGIGAVLFFFLRKSDKQAISTEDLDKRVDDQKKKVEEIHNKPVEIKSLNDDEVKDYWRN